MFIDTHCHLDINEDKDFLDNNHDIVIVSGVDDKTNHDVIELCQKYDNVYATLGIHPEEVDSFKESDLDFIEKNINNKKIVGIGEVGLDYYYTKDNKEKQKDLFIKQVILSKKYNKPLVIHSRDAIKDTYDILKEYDVSKFDIHCYSSSIEMAREFIKMGGYIGVGGVLTFKNSHVLEEVVKNIDISNILLETDSPYLAPVPLRGTKNIPSNVLYVADKIAEIKNIDKEEVLKITSENAKRLFDLDI